MPLVQIIPVEANRLKLHGTFRTPVYITPQRANAMQVGHVFSADLKSDVSSLQWIFIQALSLFHLIGSSTLESA